MASKTPFADAPPSGRGRESKTGKPARNGESRLPEGAEGDEREMTDIGNLPADVLHCLAVLLTYVIPCVLALLPVRFLTKLPSFIFRKLLHMVAFSCVTLMILAAESWQAAALASVLVAVAVYPILALLEKQPWYGELFVQKSPGEIKRSLLMLFLMFAAITAMTWGVFRRPHLTAAAILMWGTGDAAAALVGVPFGRHKVRSRLTDGKKSWEGSAAMLAVSFASGLIILGSVWGLSAPQALLFAFLGALAGTATELVSNSEWDTVTVPTVIAAVLLLLCAAAGL